MRELKDRQQLQYQPQLFYYALAPQFEWVREWCWRNNIDVKNVRYVFDKRDIAGAIDYGLILFNEVKTQNKYGFELVNLIRSRASLIKSSYETPIVTNGRIIGWKE